MATASGREPPAVHPAAAEGFERAADDYERARPTYPIAAVERLVAELGIGAGATVVDVGAGTGKLTVQLVATGARVIAVEPVLAMRAVLAARLPHVAVIDGTAERLPLPDASARAITVGQAMHWFDGDAALAAFHRVLEPGGGIGVLYNNINSEEPWVKATDDVFQPLRGTAPSQRRGEWRTAFQHTTLFTSLERAQFPNPQVLTPDEMVARVRSISFVGAMAEPEQIGVLDRVREVLATHPDTVGRQQLVLPHTTTLYWCRRR